MNKSSKEIEDAIVDKALAKVRDRPAAPAPAASPAAQQEVNEDEEDNPLRAPTDMM